MIHKSHRRPPILAASVAALLSLHFFPSGASGQAVYVANGFANVVGAYDGNTGMAIDPNFLSGLIIPDNVAISGGNIFVANLVDANNADSYVSEFSLSTGMAINMNFVTGLDNPGGLALSGNNLFVANYANGSNNSEDVGVYNATTGAVINATLISGLSGATGMAVSGNHLFVSNAPLSGAGGSVGEYDTTTGAAIKANFITGLSLPGGIAISGANMFVVDFGTGTVGEYNASTGAVINRNFIKGLFEPVGMAISGNRLYVSNFGSDTVGVYNATTGLAINTTLITGLDGAGGLAVVNNIYINALGPNTIPNSASSDVVINDLGTSGPVAISAATTTINSLTQQFTTDSTIDPSIGTLRVIKGIYLIGGNANLTIGTLPNSGVVTSGTALNQAGNLTVENDDTNSLITINSVMTNSGTGVVSVNVDGIGTTVFAGTNTYTGSTNVTNGTLQIGTPIGSASVAAGSAVTVGQGAALALVNLNGNVFANNVTNTAGGVGTVVVNSVNTNTLSGAYTDGTTGKLAFTQSGVGTTILTGSKNTYSGPTTINGGVLQIGTNGLPKLAGSIGPKSPVSVSFGGTLSLVNVNGNTFANPVSNGFGGAGTLLVNVASATTISGVLSDGANGQLVLMQNGPGAAIITNAANTYSGATNVNAGTLQVGTTTAAGSLGATSLVSLNTGATLLLTNVAGNSFSNNIVGAGLINVNAAGTVNLSGNLTDAGGSLALTQSGKGTTILTGVPSYSGATTVSSGTLQVGNGLLGNLAPSTTVNVNGTGILALDLATGGTFTPQVALNATGASLNAIQIGFTTVSQITGTGSFNQNGSGTTIMGTNVTYTGATNINAGTLQIDAIQGLTTSTVKVASGGTLSGEGTVNGTVTVATGGNLSPGDNNQPGTLTIGKLVLNTGANSNFHLGQPGGGPNTSDEVIVNGNLTIAGNLNIMELGGFGIGSYTLFNYTGTLTNMGFSAVNGTAGFITAVSTGVAHQVQLVVSGTAITQYWDGTNAANNSVIGGGSGTWNSTASNWTSADGSANSTWQTGTAVFSAPGGTVTLAATENVQGLIFGTTGYTISGTSALHLVGNGMMAPAISVTNPNDVATISAPITGIAGFVTTGAGTLVLTGATNTYTGGTVVGTGTLQIGSSKATGAPGNGTVTVEAGATLSVVNATGNTFSNAVTGPALSGGMGTMVVNSANTTTISGALSDGLMGPLALTQSNSKTLILTNVHNTFSGPTTVTGILQIGTTTAPGSVGANGSVNLAPGGQLSVINVAPGGLNTNISTNAPGVATVVSSGTGKNTLGGILSDGAGQLTFKQSGTGTTILTGNSMYRGATTVSMGTLQIGDGFSGNLSGTAVALLGTASLVTELGDQSSFSPNVMLTAATSTLKATPLAGTTNFLAGIISGLGGVQQTGAGITVLGAADTYTGATTVSGGALLVSGSTAAGSAVKVLSGGTLAGTGTIGGNVALSGTGTIFLGASGTIAGSLTVTGTNYTGTGTPIVSSWIGQGTVDGPVTVSSGIFDVTGTLTASAGVTVTGSSFFLDGTTPPGILQGNLNYMSSANSFLTGVITGPGTVTMNHAGTTLYLEGANTYAGTTTITAGTIQVGNGALPGTSLGMGQVTVNASAALSLALLDGENFPNAVINNGHLQIFSGATDTGFTITGLISGKGNIVQNGSVAVLTNANTYMGGTTVNAGVLMVNNTSGSGTGTGTVTVNSTGILGGSGTVSGQIILNSGGTVAPSNDDGVGGVTLNGSSLLFNGGGTLEFDLGATGDQLNLTGALTKGKAGLFNIDIEDVGITQTSYILATFGSTNFSSGDFNLEADDGTLAFVGNTLVLEDLTPSSFSKPGVETPNQALSDGSAQINQIDGPLAPTPEPASSGLLAIGGAALLGWRRRNSRKLGHGVPTGNQ